MGFREDTLKTDMVNFLIMVLLEVVSFGDFGPKVEVKNVIAVSLVTIWIYLGMAILKRLMQNRLFKRKIILQTNGVQGLIVDGFNISSSLGGAIWSQE